jgi:hypothetical protein
MNASLDQTFPLYFPFFFVLQRPCSRAWTDIYMVLLAAFLWCPQSSRENNGDLKI